MEKVQKGFSVSSIYEKTINYFKTNRQKLISTLILITAILMFVYALGFSTGWAIGDQFGGRIGELITKKATPANRLMLIFSGLLLVSVIISMLLGTSKRKKFTIPNYVMNSITIVMLIVTMIVYFIKINELSSAFEELLNDETLAELWERLFIINFAKASDIQFTFTIGIYILVMAFFSVIGNIYIVVDKTLYAKISRITYSDMIEQISLGKAVVYEESVNKNVEEETIKININKEAHIVDMKVDKMRYQTNGLSYMLILLSIIFVIIAGFMTITYNSFTNNADQIKVLPNLSTALDITLIILTLLLSFLGAEKTKFYQIRWAYGMMAIAVLTTLRIFFIPLNVLRNGEIPASRFSIIVILMAVAIALQVAGAVIAYIKSKKLLAHIKEIGEK